MLKIYAPSLAEEPWATIQEVISMVLEVVCSALSIYSDNIIYFSRLEWS